MRNYLYALSIIFYSFLAFAAEPTPKPTPKIQKAYVKLEDGVSRYVEYSEPQKGKPWIVMVNGLVYDLDRWAYMDKDLRAQGYGILHYYFRGQGLTLRAEVEQFKKPLFFETGLEQEDFVNELDGLLDAMKIDQKVILVGLSYGAHIASAFAETYPNRVEELVMMAPLVMSLEKYEATGPWLTWNLAWLRLVWGPYFYEYTYRYLFTAYLQQRVAPDRVPNDLKDMPEIYKESLFHLIRAARDFDLRNHDYKTLGKNSVFFMLAKEEKEAMFKDQQTAFAGLDGRAQGSLIWFPDSGHAIPDSVPADGAYYLNFLIQRDPRLSQGQKYKATSQGLIAW